MEGKKKKKEVNRKGIRKRRVGGGRYSCQGVLDLSSPGAEFPG